MSRNLVNQFNSEVAKATSIDEVRAIALTYIKAEMDLISAEVKAELGDNFASLELIYKINSEISKDLIKSLEMIISGRVLCPDWIKVGCGIAAHKAIIDNWSFNDRLSYKEKDAIEKSILSKLERDGIFDL